MTLFIPQNKNDMPPGPSRTCILGEPGVGKTRLAATFPDPFFLDLENGAGSTNQPRLHIPPSPKATALVLAEINKLATFKPNPNGALLHPAGFPINTLVIDSIDAIQEFEKYFGVLKGRSKMQIQDWDTLYNVVFPVVLAWSALPIHVVVVAHVRQEEGEDNKPGVKTFALQGSFKDRMPRWFDYILHLVAGPDGKRFVISQPMIAKGYQYKAKDRHNSLASLANNNIIELPANEDGYPSPQIATVIVGAHKNG